MEASAAAKHLAWAIVPLGVVLAIGDALTYWMFQSLSSRPPNEVAILVAMSASMAFMTAEGSLVAIWVGFGSRPLPVRFALAVPGVAIVFLPALALPNGNGALALGFGLILVAFASVPSLAARAAGWRVIRFPNVTDSTIWQPSDIPTQFTLRQMFSWTLAVAMIAGLVRVINRPQDLRSGGGALIADFALCIGCGLVALAGVWAALGRRHPLRRSLAVVLVTGLIALLILWMLVAIDLAVVMIMTWATLDALLTVGGLLLFRPAGLRLVRHRQPVVASEKPISL